MHCLFLGIAHWIVKRLWIDGRKISKTDLKINEKRAKAIKVPVDLRKFCVKQQLEKNSQINQFKHIQIGFKIFGSANMPQYLKNPFILAEFIQEK